MFSCLWMHLCHIKSQLHWWPKKSYPHYLFREINACKVKLGVPWKVHEVTSCNMFDKDICLSSFTLWVMHFQSINQSAFIWKVLNPIKRHPIVHCTIKEPTQPISKVQQWAGKTPRWEETKSWWRLLRAVDHINDNIIIVTQAKFSLQYSENYNAQWLKQHRTKVK